MTAKQATIDGLKARGFTQDVTAKSSKYLVFCKPGFNRRYLVGGAGGLRVILTGQTIASSTSLTGSRSHLAFQAVGRCAASLTSVEQADAVFADAAGLVTK